LILNDKKEIIETKKKHLYVLLSSMKEFVSKNDKINHDEMEIEDD